ncbi:DcrB-related protein [Paraburkholderia phenazinium]|uniref:DUF1795 domain-containing protein n=1 Tax=Paraburkholderia phenazinium TaxID=60549 RepID=A0A1G7VQR9_9BURK|nr:DcrB-related protein [Paraburkholderia phenazinium]SDG62103.1 hypothetical protein SAMN05216466_104185 [Paraburkholderia phenazinium]
MSEYQMNDAVIDLPAQFIDKTMHVFTVDKDGGSPFTFVVSRAPMERDDTVDTFATRLVSEMRKTLPRFELKGIQNREVDGETARELDYQWVSDGTLLHQRQTVVMSAARGEKPVVIAFIGTCPKGFTQEWTKEYASMVSSVVLKRPDTPAFVATPISASAIGVVFVLNEKSGALYTLPGMTELFRHDVTEMFDGISFYGATGDPLSLDLAPAGQPGWRAPDGRIFLLWSVDPLARPPLADRLADLKSVKGMSGLSSVDDVRDYLASVANAH